MTKKMYKKPQVESTKMEPTAKVCLTSTLGGEINGTDGETGKIVSQAPHRQV